MVEILVGALVTFIEPGTGAGLCGRVVNLGEGAAGVPTVWAVQQGGSRTLKAPVAEVKPGCDNLPRAAVPATVPPAPPSPPPGPKSVAP